MFERDNKINFCKWCNKQHLIFDYHSENDMCNHCIREVWEESLNNNNSSDSSYEDLQITQKENQINLMKLQNEKLQQQINEAKLERDNIRNKMKENITKKIDILLSYSAEEVLILSNPLYRIWYSAKKNKERTIQKLVEELLYK